MSELELWFYCWGIALHIVVAAILMLAAMFLIGAGYAWMKDKRFRKWESEILKQDRRETDEQD